MQEIWHLVNQVVFLKERGQAREEDGWATTTPPGTVPHHGH